jgi:hypothetical protein
MIQQESPIGSTQHKTYYTSRLHVCVGVTVSVVESNRLMVWGVGCGVLRHTDPGRNDQIYNNGENISCLSVDSLLSY